MFNLLPKIRFSSISLSRSPSTWSPVPSICIGWLSIFRAWRRRFSLFVMKSMLQMISLIKVLDRLDRTFITPFDREDIHDLIGLLDDIVDSIDALGKRFPLFHVKEMSPYFVKQTDVLVQATSAVSEAVHRLREPEAPNL